MIQGQTYSIANVYNIISTIIIIHYNESSFLLAHLFHTVTVKATFILRNFLLSKI